MKLRGKLKDLDIVVLIDCGATHNFIASYLVQVVELEVTKTGNYGVVKGTGTAIKGRGICQGVQLQVGEIIVVSNFLPLSLGGVDAILGMQWLHTLGVTVVDWRNLLMKIVYGGKEITLKGDARLAKSRISLKNLVKTWSDHDHGFLVECRYLEGEGEIMEVKEKPWEEEMEEGLQGVIQ